MIRSVAKTLGRIIPQPIRKMVKDGLKSALFDK